MYPEAGGSSSLRAPRLQRVLVLLRRLGPDAQLHDHDRHLGVLRAALRRRPVLGAAALLRPATSSFGIVVVVVLCAVNVRGVKESAGVNIGLAVTDFLHPAAARPRRRWSSCFSPETLVDNVHLGVAPTWKDFFLAIPVGMIAYTGIETISNMAEEARDETKTIPAAIKRVVIAVFAIYARAAGRRAVGAAGVPQNADGDYVTLLGLSEDQGGFAGDPILGVVKQIDLGVFQGAGRDLRRPAGGDDPLHRHERRHHRRVAARVLDGPAPPGARPPAPAAPALRDAVDRDPALRRDRLRDDDPGPGGVPGQHLRVRRDALVHRSRTSRSSACGSPTPTGRARTAGRAPCGSPVAELPLFAVLGGIGTGLAFVVVTFLHLDVAARRAWAGWRSGCVIYPLYRRRQGLDLTTTTKVAVPKPGHRPRGRVRVGPRRAATAGEYSAGAMATAIKLAARRAPRHPRARHDHRARSRRRSAPSCPSRSSPPRRSSSRPSSRAAGASPATGRRSAPARPAASSSTRRGRCARRPIVVPLPRRGERVAVRQDRRDGPGRAPGAGRAAQRPRRPLGRRRAGTGPSRAPRARGRRADAGAPEPPRGASQVLSARHGPPRRGDPRLDARARRRPARARRPPRRPLRRGRGRPPLRRTCARAVGHRRCGAASGWSDALRDRLHGGRERRSTSRSASSPTTRSGSRRSSSCSRASSSSWRR